MDFNQEKFVERRKFLFANALEFVEETFIIYEILEYNTTDMTFRFSWELLRKLVIRSQFYQQ